MILVQQPSKPFPTTEKFSVKAKEALALYSPEIEAAYTSLETASSTPSVPLPSRFEYDDILAYVDSVILKVLGRPLAADKNLFENGTRFL